MLLGDVRHQDFAHRLIQRAVSRDSIPHAYLFHGPDGVGRERLARGFAQLLLCTNPVEHTVNPAEGASLRLERSRTGCGACEDCRAVIARAHPDLHLVYRQLNREHPDSHVRKRKALELGVDVIRHFLIDRVALTSIRGRAKVFIVQEADCMTPQAQNALLKTLEEPPGTTVIILLATAMDRLLPTTISRCQVVRFGTLPRHFVQQKLAELLPEMSAAMRDWYAQCGEGSVGRGVQWAEDALYEVNDRIMPGLAALNGCPVEDAAAGSSAAAGEEIAATWSDEAKALADQYRRRDPDISATEADRRAFKTLFQLSATWYADIARLKAGHTSAVVNKHVSAAFARLTDAFADGAAIDAIGRIARAERQLDLNANVQLCVDVLLNELARTVRRRPSPAVS